MDDDGSHSLNKEEFSKGIRETGLHLSEDDTDKLFGAFDKDGGGTINYEEFLVAIRVSYIFLLDRKRRPYVVNQQRWHAI